MGEIFNYNEDRSAYCIICDLHLESRRGVPPHTASKKHKANLIKYKKQQEVQKYAAIR